MHKQHIILGQECIVWTVILVTLRWSVFDQTVQQGLKIVSRCRWKTCLYKYYVEKHFPNHFSNRKKIYKIFFQLFDIFPPHKQWKERRKGQENREPHLHHSASPVDEVGQRLNQLLPQAGLQGSEGAKLSHKTNAPVFTTSQLGTFPPLRALWEIGRASCRERV